MVFHLKKETEKQALRYKYISYLTGLSSCPVKFHHVVLSLLEKPSTSNRLAECSALCNVNRYKNYFLPQPILVFVSLLLFLLY